MWGRLKPHPSDFADQSVPGLILRPLRQFLAASDEVDHLFRQVKGRLRTRAPVLWIARYDTDRYY